MGDYLSLAENPERIDLRVLRQFDELHEFIGARSTGSDAEAATAVADEPTGTADERMAG